MTRAFLEPAYVWLCPHCGHENYQREIRLGVAPLDRPEGEFVALAMGHPEHVKCRGCGEFFQACDEAA